MLRLKTFGGLVILRDGAPAEGAGAQRRRLALLALLASAGERGLSREKILGILWPESDLDRARKNLAQAVYALRRDLGADDLILGTTDLRLNPECLATDLEDFQHAIRDGKPELAVALYGGPFLDGIYLEEAPEFDRWAETERVHLAHAYAAALEQVARAADQRGEHHAAIGFWRKFANSDPLNAKAALGLMRALRANGDRAAALLHFRVYEMLLRQELDVAPEAEVRRLAEELRREEQPPRPGSSAPPPASPSAAAPLAAPLVATLPGTPAVSRPAPSAATPERRMISGFTDEYARPRPVPERPAPREAAPPSPGAMPGRPRPPFLRRRGTQLGIAIGFASGLIVTAIVMGRFQGANRPAGSPVPTIAVGLIQDYTRRGEQLGRPLADMLATDLARAPAVQVISTARMYELVAQGGGPGADTASAIMRAARAAGATQLINGTLSDRTGRLRLDLQRVDLATGNVLQAYTAEGLDLFGLVDSTRAVLAPFGGATAGGSLADVTTRSVLAYRLYEEGLRALFSGDQAGAQRLLAQALAEDSTFAMAAYWLAQSGGGYNEQSTIRGLERAMRLARHASDRERLTIVAGWANAVDDPSRTAIAETLTVRYPNEPEGYLWLGHSRMWGGDFLGAIAPLRKVIAMDSLALRRYPLAAEGTPVRCHACVAYVELIFAYQLLDSLPAAERTAREWARIQPRNPDPWGQLAWVLTLQERYAEAQAADQQVVSVAPQIPREGTRAQMALRAGNFAPFEEYYGSLQEGPLASEGHKWMSIGLRTEGRPRAALEPARKLRALERAARRDAAPYNALFEAQVWYELGEYRHAAALFDSISRSPRDSTPSQLARHRVWTQTLRATALAAAGDTAELAALADSVESWGRGSAYGRDPLLHHHIRGLLYAARGKLEDAASEYRASVFSPTGGYTRTNIELAKVLMRLNRPRDAAYWAEAALRGGLDAAASYATLTELAEVAAIAWDAAGEKNKAIHRYQQVLNNWKRAEPAFGARIERARIRLAMLMTAR